MAREIELWKILWDQHTQHSARGTETVVQYSPTSRERGRASTAAGEKCKPRVLGSGYGVLLSKANCSVVRELDKCVYSNREMSRKWVPIRISCQFRVSGIGGIEFISPGRIIKEDTGGYVF